MDFLEGLWFCLNILWNRQYALCQRRTDVEDNGDFLEMCGTLTVLNPLHLQFNGQIITRVEHINNGKPVKREGTYNFTVAGQRRYWRMQEMNNPKDGYCDYVDIYFD